MTLVTETSLINGKGVSGVAIKCFLHLCRGAKYSGKDAGFRFFKTYEVRAKKRG